MNIFDLSGPTFLEVYFFLLFICLFVAWGLPHLFRFPADLPFHPPENLSPFEIAYLREGRLGAIRAALIALYNRGLIAVDRTTHTFKPVPTAAAIESASHLNICETLLLREIESGQKELSQLRKTQIPPLFSRRLLDAQFLLSPTRRFFLGTLRILPYAILLFVGLTKVSIGISRGKPVEILVLLCLLTAALAYGTAQMLPFTTLRGKKVLDELKVRHSHFEFASKRRKQDVTWADESLAFALFGAESLAFGSAIALAVNPPKPITASSWGGSSSDGGGCSSCSGGSSCGSGCGGCSGS